MAISKIILNGVTQMDVTGKTVTSASMLNGITALKNDGTDITGSIQDMTLPSAASSTSSGTAKATITPTSSAQYLNIPTGYNDTAQFYTIAAASGGASNVVTGTFKGTTTGAAMDVNIPYTGSGYPIAVMVFPSATDLSTFNSMLQRYIIRDWFMDNYERSVPSYSGSSTHDRGVVTTKYKNSSSNASSYSDNGSTGANTTIYNDINATANATYAITIRSATKMSVFIASTSYGFAANIEYTYHIIYSS